MHAACPELAHPSRTPWRERGATSLIVTLILFFVMTLVAAYANRNHVFEQRASANRYRATQAFEAAEAGLEWATAMLNTPQPIDERCLPATAPGTSFRDRFLQIDASSGSIEPAHWDNAGVATPLRAVCVRHGSQWGCACPTDTASRVTAPAGEPDAPAFSISFAPEPHAHVVRIFATGCATLRTPCDESATSAADASSTLQASLGLLPALATPPVAPLTVRGSVQAGAAALGLQHADPATGGFTAHAGGSVVAPQARLTTAPGGALAASVIEGDDALANGPADRLFAALFGLDKAAWQQHPGLRRIRCTSPCNDALAQALQDTITNRLVWVDGDMTLRGPIEIGTRERPVLIVVTGAMQFDGGVSMNGLLYAGSLAWQGSGAAVVRGGLVSESNYRGDAAPDLVYDRTVLATLRTRSGSFARVAGSWRDF